MALPSFNIYLNDIAGNFRNEKVRNPIVSSIIGLVIQRGDGEVSQTIHQSAGDL